MWPFPYLVYKHLYSPSSSSTPATYVSSLSRPQNIFLIEFAEQPKSPRMLSHPSTSSTGTPHIYRLSNFLTLHWGSNQILQVSWPHVCHFHRYQLSTYYQSIFSLSYGHILCRIPSMFPENQVGGDIPTIPSLGGTFQLPESGVRILQHPPS